MLAGAATIFFAYIGFDSISTHAEEAKNPQRDVPLGIIVRSSACTILYIAVAAVLTGMVRYDQIAIDAPVSQAFAQVGLPWAQFLVSLGALTGITSVLLVLMLSQPRVWLGDGARRFVPTSFFGAVHDKYRTPWKSTILTGVIVGCRARSPLRILAELTNIGTLFAFVVVCAAVLVMRRTHPRGAAPVPRATVAAVTPILGIAICLLLMFSLPGENWLRCSWLAGPSMVVVYFGYGRHHSVPAKNAAGSSAIRAGHGQRAESLQGGSEQCSPARTFEQHRPPSRVGATGGVDANPRALEKTKATFDRRARAIPAAGRRLVAAIRGCRSDREPWYRGPSGRGSRTSCPTGASTPTSRLLQLEPDRLFHDAVVDVGTLRVRGRSSWSTTSTGQQRVVGQLLPGQPVAGGYYLPGDSSGRATPPTEAPRCASIYASADSSGPTTRTSPVTGRPGHRSFWLRGGDITQAGANVRRAPTACAFTIPAARPPRDPRRTSTRCSSPWSASRSATACTDDRRHGHRRLDRRHRRCGRDRGLVTATITIFAGAGRQRLRLRRQGRRYAARRGRRGCALSARAVPTCNGDAGNDVWGGVRYPDGGTGNRTSASAAAGRRGVHLREGTQGRDRARRSALTQLSRERPRHWRPAKRSGP